MDKNSFASFDSSAPHASPDPISQVYDTTSGASAKFDRAEEEVKHQLDLVETEEKQPHQERSINWTERNEEHQESRCDFTKTNSFQ
ncbi:unnamed protein product [Haemonchus placei]|uniref:Uncharacterized protein n=1 Tax=Haemonchus placei TaxID=6290 RepID=A0A0N4W278_HAEPC|nr:unnamed protein product [Haemonchus placei]